MVFIASTTTTFETANSYISVAEAEALIANFEKDGRIWNANTTEYKEISLIRSSIMIDNLYAYKGKKTKVDQILQFPRNESDEIILPVKISTALLAYDIYKGKLYNNVIAETIGELSLRYNKDKGYTLNREVINYLKPYRKRIVNFI